MDIGETVVVTTRGLNGSSQTPMILQKIIIDKSKIPEGVLSIGVDGYNINGAIDSIG
jgi:hypothetical protein